MQQADISMLVTGLIRCLKCANRSGRAEAKPSVANTPPRLFSTALAARGSIKRLKDGSSEGCVGMSSSVSDQVFDSVW